MICDPYATNYVDLSPLRDNGWEFKLHAHNSSFYEWRDPILGRWQTTTIALKVQKLRTEQQYQRDKADRETII